MVRATTFTVPLLALLLAAPASPVLAATFGVPVGMSAEEWGADRVNLLPAEYLQRKERRGSYIAVAVILAVIFIVAGRLESALAKMRGHVRSSDVVTARCCGAALEQIACEELDMAANGLLSHERPRFAGRRGGRS